MQLRLGHFREFRGFNRVVLICGDSAGLHLVALRLRELENPKAAPVELHSLPFAEVHGDVKLTAMPVERELGVRAVSEEPSCRTFFWHHSGEGWLEAAEKIERVANAGAPAHNYLTAIGPADATVMVSMGEYDDRWWEAHG